MCWLQCGHDKNCTGTHGCQTRGCQTRGTGWQQCRQSPKTTCSAIIAQELSCFWQNYLTSHVDSEDCHKNMPIYDIECEVEREMVRYGKVKSVKTVLDTAHNLVEIVEQKIVNMMKLAPVGQIIVDGYTVAGQHYVAVFASFMRNCTSITEGNELKYDRHELRLLACAPLPPIDGDIENKNEESTDWL